MAGEILGGHYELMESIGRGVMATIYRARDRYINQVFAVKVLRETYSTDPKFITRFRLEARAAALLSHPSIVRVHDYGQSADNYYIVMEYIEGIDLGRYLKTHHILDVEQAVVIAHDVALGLGYAHQGNIVHRDVKPQNIMIDGEGLAKLIDFGSASMYEALDAERLTPPGMAVGPIHYFAPEQAAGQIVSPAADVYALGIVMYEMLTGKPPFAGNSAAELALHHIQDLPELPRKQNPKISLELQALILRCLEKDPRDRYANGYELAKALDNYDALDEEDNDEELPSSAPFTSPLIASLGNSARSEEEASPVSSRRAGGLLSRFGSGAGTQHQPAQRPLPPPEPENVKERDDAAAPAQRKKPRVFVSHSHKNDDFTARFVADLRAAGVEVWVDMVNMQYGDFITRINQALDTSEWLVLVLTPEAIASEPVKTEVHAAISRVWRQRMKGFIPFMALPCDPETIPAMWDTFHRYDATSDYKRALAGLLRAMGIE